MKKALFVANVYKHLYTFHQPYIQMLQENGYQVDVIAARDDREVALANNCYYWDLTRSPFNFKNISAYNQLKKLVENEKYALIHCHTATAAVITRLAARKVRKNGTKVIYTAHGFHFYKGSPKLFWILYYPIEKFVSRWTDAIVLINVEDYNLVQKSGFRNQKTYYLHSIGINSKRFENVDMENRKKIRLEEGYNEHQFLMIYVAEFISRKNHRFLIKASLELAKKIDDFKILFVGRGKLLQTTQAYVLSIGADQYIDFLGVRFDLNRLFPMCDIGVTSSRQEGLAMAVAEEMFCGLPVLATQSRGHRELVLYGETGFLFKQGDIADFVKYVVKLYESPENRATMGKTAHLHAQNFKIEQSLMRMAEIYSETLQKKIKYIQDVK